MMITTMAMMIARVMKAATRTKATMTTTTITTMATIVIMLIAVAATVSTTTTAQWRPPAASVQRPTHATGQQAAALPMWWVASDKGAWRDSERLEKQDLEKQDLEKQT